MGIFNLFSSNKNKKDGYDHLRNHPNRLSKQEAFIQLAKNIASQKSKIIEIKEMTQQLAKNEIQDWRTAHQMALNVENPKTYKLHQIFTDTKLDGHLIGARRNRKIKTLGRKFKITNQGTLNEEATKLLNARWFKKSLNYSLDSIYEGPTLLQFEDLIREGKLRFKNVKVVPRPHVVAKFNVVLKELSDEPKDGIDYTKPPYSNWLIMVGDPDDLGLLLPVSKDVISKKYALQFWDQFAELFGMPIRIGKTSSRNTKDIEKIESMLEDMGSAAWGLFPQGSEIEIVESTKGDSWMVYDKRIERANSEISKAILGQTMTMDNGSSKSQALVHETVSDEIAEEDADFIRDLVNDDFLPFFRMHGFPIHENDEFEWDDTYTYSPEEMKEIEEMILQHFQVDPQYFIDKYGITITGKKTSSTEPVDLEKKK